MKRTCWLLLATTVITVSACIDFDAVRTQCDQPGGRCFSDAGATGGGGSTSTGGGSGGCAGCYSASNCNPTPKDDDTNCGAPNVMCIDCGANGMCRGYVCESKRSWKKKYTEANEKQLNALWVSPTGVVSAAGKSGTLIQGNGTNFREATLPTEVFALTGASIDGKQSLVTTGPNGIARVACIVPFEWTDSLQHTFDQISDTYHLSGAWAAGGEVYVGGARQLATDAGVVAKLTDAGWVEQSIKPHYNEVLAGWGNTTGYVFISDDPYLVRVPASGGAETVQLPLPANAVSGGTANNVWVAGDNGFVGRLVGTTWARFDTAPAYSWGSIVPISDTRVFVGGWDGTNAAIGEWDGVQWRITTFGPGAFRAMHATALSTLWAVDSHGSVWHFE